MKTNSSHHKGLIISVVAGLAPMMVLAVAGNVRAATWKQKADMPTARWALSTSVVNGKIYAIGGVDNPKKVEEYDPATDTWTQKADMPSTRVFIASSAVDGRIYVIGGETHWQGGTKLATVEEYDPATDTWTQKADMPTPRNALGTSVVNGRIYAIGGGSTTISVKKVEEYDPVTDTWTQKANMLTGMKQGSSTSVVNGKIYAFGGGPFNAPAGSVVQEYDPVTDTWTKKADMPAPRGGFSTAAVNGKIYVLGGTTTHGGAPLSTLFQYDPATDTWTSREDMPVRLLGMGASTVGKRIYVIGGTSVSYPYNPPLATVWEFIPQPEFDFNEDGIVDARDVSLMVDHWHTDEPRYDLAPAPDGDGIVDVQDLILLSEHLFEDDRTVAQWTLDETDGLTAHDSLGVNDGFVVGNPVWLPNDGQVGGAIELDGVGDYVGTPFVRNPGEGSFSVFAWIQGGAAGQVVLSQVAASNWLLFDPVGALMTDLTGIGRKAKPLHSQAVIVDGNWHHVGLTWDGVTRKLWVDRVAVAEGEPGVMPDTSEGLNIGCGALLEPGSFFAGRLDDVVVYDRAIEP